MAGAAPTHRGHIICLYGGRAVYVPKAITLQQTLSDALDCLGLDRTTAAHFGFPHSDLAIMVEISSLAFANVRDGAILYLCKGAVGPVFPQELADQARDGLEERTRAPAPRRERARAASNRHTLPAQEAPAPPARSTKKRVRDAEVASKNTVKEERVSDNEQRRAESSVEQEEEEQLEDEDEDEAEDQESQEEGTSRQAYTYAPAESSKTAQNKRRKTAQDATPAYYRDTHRQPAHPNRHYFPALTRGLPAGRERSA